MAGSVPRPRPAPRSGSGSAGAPSAAPPMPTTRTKLVVRRLPPTLTQDAFLAELAAKLGCAEAEPQCGGHLVWARYLPGRPGPKRPCPSLAYLAVRLESQLQEVVAAVLSLAFVSDKGASFQPAVEFAPYQRVPKPPSGRKDVREGTLDKEAEYLAFVEALSAPAPPKPSAETVAAGADAKKVLMGAGSEVYETPLMAFMKARSEARAKQRSAGKASRRTGAAKGDGAGAAPAAAQRTKKSGAKSGDWAGSSSAAGERGKHKQSGGASRPEAKGPSTSVVINPSNAGVVSSGSSYAAAAGSAGAASGAPAPAPPAPRVLARPLSGGNLSGQAQAPPPPRREGKQMPVPKAVAAGIEVFYGSSGGGAQTVAPSAENAGQGQGKGGRPHGKGRSGGRGGRGGGGGGGGGAT